MVFPRAPKKPIKNKLKLVVRPPETSVEISDGPTEEYTGEDLSDQLEFRMPRGFHLDTDNSSVYDRQKKNIISQLEKIEKRATDCGNCRTKTDLKDVENAQAVIEESFNVLKSFKSSSSVVQTLLNQDVDGPISLQFSLDDKEILVDFSKDVISIGKFHLGKHIEKTEKSLYNYLSWLIQPEPE